jgi:hypothetical protein
MPSNESSSNLSASVTRAEVVSPPDWAGPPLEVLPGIVPAELIIGRAEETVVAIAGIEAYPTGFGFILKLRLRHLSVERDEQFPYLLGYGRPEDAPLPSDILRLTIEFADGRIANNVDRSALSHTKAPDIPVLIEGNSGGGGTVWDMDEWVWPLPPKGPLAFVCEWRARGLAESRTEIDAGLILEAAQRAVTFW